VRQVTKGPISAGRQCRSSSEWRRGQSVRGAGRVDLPLARRGFEAIFGLRQKRSGTREWSTQEGPQKVGRFWLRGFRFLDAWPDRSKDQRTFGPRSLVDGLGSSSEGAVRSEATPELVSQDRERVGAFGISDQVTNTGISFARRSGGWQQCRPPFPLCQRALLIGTRGISPRREWDSRLLLICSPLAREDQR